MFKDWFVIVLLIGALLVCEILFHKKKKKLAPRNCGSCKTWERDDECEYRGYCDTLGHYTVENFGCGDFK
jgi:hypothetical protein